MPSRRETARLMGEHGENPGGRPELIVDRIALGCGNFGGIGSAPGFFG
jgi:hypothetical protein